MSLEKAIKSGKEKRKPYYGSKAFDRTCRNHGTCKWCEENRLYKNKKKLAAALAQDK
jgi:hypothetical protein